MEDRPNEVFIHVSAARCWEMVRERLNLEIAKQHKLGKQNLPPLQPPGSLDGFEMFGFSSPAIVQVRKAGSIFVKGNAVCTKFTFLIDYHVVADPVGIQNLVHITLFLHHSRKSCILLLLPVLFPLFIDFFSRHLTSGLAFIIL